MSDQKDNSDNDSFALLYNNEEQMNSYDVDVDISANEHEHNNLLSQSDPAFFQSLSKNLLNMAQKLKIWSSKFIFRDGDETIDILQLLREPHLLSHVVRHNNHYML